MKVKNAAATLWAGLVLSVLAGCGGGGSDSSVASDGSAVGSASSAEGAYEGTTSTGRAFDTIVLEDGQYWTIYGQISSGAFLVEGLIQGTGQASNGSFSSSDLKDFYYTGASASGSLSATYNPGVSFNGTMNSFSPATFTASASTSSTYNYNSSANLADISGAWSMTVLTGASATLNIAANGSFSGMSGGCSFSGTIAPRASGKNVFTVTTTFGASPCTLANQTVTGIGVSYILANSQRELMVAAVDGTRAHGTLLIGVR